MIVLLWVFLLVLALILFNRETFSRFKKHGVKHFKPVPLLGNLADVVFRKKHISELFDDMYYAFSNERFVGRFEFTRPVVILHDIELIKKITVKDFEHFLDHRSMVDDTMDPLFGRNLFALRSQEWKDMRSTLSPAFTSSKMRLMVPFMVEVSDLMMHSLKKQMKESDSDYVDLDVLDLTTRYANDVIASCAFGMKVDSQSHKDNEFYTIGKDTANISFRKGLVMVGYSAFPQIMKALGITFFTDTTNKFFRSIILNTMKDREAKNIQRPDMIHLLMEAKKGKLSHDEKISDDNAGFATVEESHVGQTKVNREWSNDDLVAQAVLFFLAGFDTVSTAMSFLLYELARNPDVQDRLAEEIQEQDVKNGRKFDFKSIQDMTYLDMVVSELLRLWPPAVGMDRLCVKDYNMGKPNSQSTSDYIIRKGEALTIPAWSFHHDAKYFPDPYHFDPERFSEENKHKIKPFTYMPFGLGPRNCIGSRFALCEIKVMAYQLLQKMEVTMCEKTTTRPEVAADSFSIRIKGGLWVRFKERK